VSLIQRITAQIYASLKPGGILVVTEPLWTDRHVDLGLQDKDESKRIHDAVIERMRQSIKNPSIGRELVKYCVDVGLEITEVKVYTSTQRTLSEFHRVTYVQAYADIPRFVEERSSFLSLIFLDLSFS
jgi:hypothetical protein